VDISAFDGATTVPRGETFRVRVSVRNRSSVALASFGPQPYHLAYRWLTAAGDELVEPVRSRLWPILEANGEQTYEIGVRAPDVPGRAILRVTMVQELVQWFDWKPGGAQAEREIEIV